METFYPEVMASLAAPVPPPPAVDAPLSLQERFPRLWVLLSRDGDTLEAESARKLLQSVHADSVYVNLWDVWREMGLATLRDVVALLGIPIGFERNKAVAALLRETESLGWVPEEETLIWRPSLS